MLVSDNGVVYAVAACHSVHTFEEVEVEEPLVARLIGLMPARSPRLARRLADRFTGFAGRLIPQPTQSARWTFATAGSLAFATFAVLLFGFSDDGTVRGIYRQAHVKASELYTQGGGGLQPKPIRRCAVGASGAGHWGVLGHIGRRDQIDGKDNHDQKQNRTQQARIREREEPSLRRSRRFLEPYQHA